MVITFRQLAPLLQRFQLKPRFYARKPITTTDADMKQVHQENLRYIYPYAKIKVDSDINVKIYSADPHEYPDGDALVAELHGDPVKNCTASMEVKVSDDKNNVEVIIKKIAEFTNFHCELAVPIKAALEIKCREKVIVENTCGDELDITADKYIKTKNIRAERIKLLTCEGDITCEGILLGKYTSVETKNKGNIVVDKLQGDNILCKTSQGNITTNCSYVESSKFETYSGCLDLKNVHKKTAVTVQQKGDLKMTGLYGNLKVVANGGSMNLQLSELRGQNTIEAKNLTTCKINISDDIEKDTSLDICLIGDVDSSTITLDSTLDHLSSALTENKRQFKWSIDQNKPSNLKVISNSSLTLGKSSWIDVVCLQAANTTAKKY